MPHLPTRGRGRVWAHPCQPRLRSWKLPCPLPACPAQPVLPGPRGEEKPRPRCFLVGSPVSAQLPATPLLVFRDCVPPAYSDPLSLHGPEPTMSMGVSGDLFSFQEHTRLPRLTPSLFLGSVVPLG